MHQIAEKILTLCVFILLQAVFILIDCLTASFWVAGSLLFLYPAEVKKNLSLHLSDKTSSVCLSLLCTPDIN